MASARRGSSANTLTIWLWKERPRKSTYSVTGEITYEALIVRWCIRRMIGFVCEVDIVKVGFSLLSGMRASPGG